jgi:nucleoside phosphorylase
MSDPDSYTVGWVSALPIEPVAAQSLLDERHEPLANVSPGDNDSYTLGTIGNHRVVIAILPDGQYGTSAVASVVRDMLRIFRKIRISLMVGIGSGAPSRRNDIHLSDIVVSAYSNWDRDVLQYDFGRTIHDQASQITGFLNRPPAVLRAAVSNIRAQYEINGRQLEQTFEALTQQSLRLQKSYARQPQDSDRLYQPSATQTQGPLKGANCAEDPLRLHIRSPQKNFDDNQVVHYGRIASVNQLIKDAVTRDGLATKRGVLRFEMETAGLMNHFPCIVIRGICDHSDTHSNDVWQCYAAMTAAAYAKDLLLRISAERLRADNPISRGLYAILVLRRANSSLIYHVSSLAPPPANGNSQPETTNQPNVMPQNRTRHWVIMEQVSLDAVTSDISRYDALREALSDRSLQELLTLQWAGREEPRWTSMTLATDAENLLRRHDIRLYGDIDAWPYVKAAKFFDTLPPRDRALFLGVYAGYHLSGTYVAEWARAGLASYQQNVVANGTYDGVMVNDE